MNNKEIKLLGKLQIYIHPIEKINDRKIALIKRLFPKYTYAHLIKEANKAGIINVAIFNTFTNFKKNSSFHLHSKEAQSHKQHFCIELIDTVDKLNFFYNKHAHYLKDKIVIFNEVESWHNS